MSLRRLPTWTQPWAETAQRLGEGLVGRWTFAYFGPDGILGDDGQHSSVIVTCAEQDGEEWVHASVAHQLHLPSYHDLVVLHRAVWGEDGFAYQIFASSERHVSIHNYALHLWGRADGRNVLPDFGAEGTI